MIAFGLLLLIGNGLAILSLRRTVTRAIALGPNP